MSHNPRSLEQRGSAPPGSLLGRLRQSFKQTRNANCGAVECEFPEQNSGGCRGCDGSRGECLGEVLCEKEAVQCGGFGTSIVQKAHQTHQTATKKRIIRQLRKALPSSPAFMGRQISRVFV